MTGRSGRERWDRVLAARRQGRAVLGRGAASMPDLKPASRLRLARVAKGWRIGALADQIGVPASTLWRIETGAIKEPRLGIRKALAKALGANEADLFRKM